MILVCLYILYTILIFYYICTISNIPTNSAYIIVLRDKISTKYFNNNWKTLYLIGVLS